MDRTDLVVVALPREGDYVRKISSEKEPHLTLLYLGANPFDATEMELVVGQIEHAASQLSPFTLEVEKRGELGDKNADVLFFYKEWTKDLALFRSHLLQNELIRKAYLIPDQFPSWTPHLTLGYPDNPAKNDPNDGEFNWVSFDRIALWVDDSVGPTFELKYPDTDMEVAMSQIERGRAAMSDVLSHSDFNLEDEYGGLLDLLETYISEVEDDAVKHYGVKGMKWGVRKAETKTPREPLKSLGPDSVSRKTASGETITLKKMQPTKLHNLMGRMSKKYREEYSKTANLDILDSSGKKVGDAIVEKKNDDELYLNWLGINKSARGKGYATAVMKAGRDFGKQQGFKRMTLEVPGNSPDARHIYEKMGFKVTKEAEDTDDFWGGLTEMAYEFDAAQSSLSHYGVKGMKWGVRRSDAELASAPSGPKPRLSDDAKVVEKLHGKIETSGTSSLSNQEMRQYLERMDLERRFQQSITSPSPRDQAIIDRGHNQVKRILAIGNTIEKTRKFLETPTGEAVKTGVKTAAAAGFGYFTGGAGPAAAAGAGVIVRRMTR
jgi:RimJ/RimL family protein N-acetyltransferase/2'-5' RNA ligase